MGSDHHQTVEVDPQALSQAKQLWASFMSATVYGVIGVVILLAGMAFFLVG